MKNLRIKTFQPETQYLHLTYAIKNNEKDKSRELLQAYKELLNKGIKYVFSEISIKKQKNKTRVYSYRKRKIYTRS